MAIIDKCEVTVYDEENNLNLTMQDEDGKELECEALFSFLYKETGKSYIVYQILNSGEEDDICASLMISSGEDMELIPVETDDEYDMIEEVMDAVL
ncbi:MAG: DUF1292 domain-containing protein [Oscillospiraceae bacterium]